MIWVGGGAIRSGVALAKVTSQPLNQDRACTAVRTDARRILEMAQIATGVVALRQRSSYHLM